MSMDDLPAAKRAVRERVLRARSGLGDAERAAKSAMICTAIKSLPVYIQAQSILFYMPVRGEADVLPLILAALAEGRVCALPRCSDGSSLRLFRITDAEMDLEPGRWGIREPKESLIECTLDDFSAILVPGVAFDRSGGRIGYGAGYYDRLLAGAKAVTIAPAFVLQVLPELPRGGHDVPVDIIATETETIFCHRAGECIS